MSSTVIKNLQGEILYESTTAADLQTSIKEAAQNGVCLCGAYLYAANLRNINLRGADLRGADLRGADLRGANLCHGNLYAANLRDADLSYADLRSVHMCNADLCNANLQNTVLHRGDLRDANLYGTNLCGADLHDVNLYNANLRDAINIPIYVAAQTSILPEGDLIGWKKASGEAIVKLRIPADTRRSNATGRICRAEHAEVLAIFHNSNEITVAVSQFDKKFEYRVGTIVTCDERFDTNRWQECGSGIHFFITREEAEMI